MRVLVTGGAGYIGQVLVPKLVDLGHDVTVLDALWFGADGLQGSLESGRLAIVEGDIRDRELVSDTLREGRFDAVIHLAAISNDPCSDLDEGLTRAVNLEALEHVMRASKAHGVKRFLYASSASVYGIKETEDVTEDLSLEPITLYARYKAEGEAILNDLIGDDFVGVSVRAATVCGYSPRLRLDLTINILTSHALTGGKIKVFGGDQMRPNIHIQDLARLYTELLTAPAELVNGQAFNVSAKNASVMQLAEMIRDTLGNGTTIEVVDNFDPRSYHLSASKLAATLGFEPELELETAVFELRDAFGDGRVADPGLSEYRNIVWMNQHPDRWQR